MKYYFVIFFTLIGIVVFSSIVQAYATIETTQFDLQVSSDYFHEPNLNRHHLVMKPGDSQQVTIHITNNDSKPHAIDLQMAKETPRPERSFAFEPAQLEIRPGETATSIMTVSASSEADTGTTIFHTLIAKSMTFGTKAFGFYFGVHEEITPPQPDIVRRGSPGGMFSSTTQFDIDENYAINKVPYNIITPNIPDEYSFQGMYGLEFPEQLIYSKQPVSSDTGELEFWDNGGLLISFFDKKDFTYDDYLESLNSNEQQVRINGKNGIASEYQLISTSNDQKIYSNSRVTVFLDDVQLRVTSQMPLELILQIAESMTETTNQEQQPKPKIILENQFFDDFDLAAEGNDVFIVWEEFDKEKADVYLTKSTDGGTSFSDKINLSKSPGIPREPIVKVSGNYVYVVWYEETKLNDGSIEDVYIASSPDKGETFSEPINLSKDNHYTSITSNFDPDVAAIGNNVHVVWLSGQHDWFQTFLASSYDGGKTFQTKRLSHNDNEMSHEPIIAASDNNVYVGWSQRIENNVYHAKMMITVSNDNGKSFSQSKDLSPAKTTSHEQTLYAFDGNIFVSWRDEVEKRNVSFVKSSDKGKTFSEIKSIAYGARPNLSGDENNIFVSVWCGDEQHLDQVCLVKSSDGADSFSEQIQISDITWTKSPYAEAPTPKIASRDDTVYVSWKYSPEERGQNKLYLATSVDGGDTFTEQIVVGETGEDPKMVVSKNKMYLVWVDDLGEKNNLYLLTDSHPYLEDIECGEGTELVDGVCQVIDMNTPPFNNGDCLIATASYGSKLAPQVQMLREVRDNVLLSTYSGTLFMGGFNTVYYSFSPEIAQLEHNNPIFKETVKIFITPMITTLSIMTLAEEGSEFHVVLFGLSTIGLIVGMYVVVPTAVIWKITKRKSKCL